MAEEEEAAEVAAEPPKEKTPKLSSLKFKKNPAPVPSTSTTTSTNPARTILKTKEQLIKLDKTKELVRENVLNWQECVALQARGGATEELQTALRRAQERQKMAQKLMTQKQLESYVKGWNPWTVMKQLYPARNTGKKRKAPPTQAARDDVIQWKRLMKVADTLDKAYNHLQ
ncbi:hypothetical protein PTTG_28359 [Puccinia triticina 1-1 BBBD Race 1]|uniref:Uncharacterized protein n=1 Tax=Puccinia triticina (isolate 1-1 / race 1 (BBBD)) TaxID=630390 RepID=A0A180GCF2_PUCT1|nr:hypothetical protein PTTG_28359 [Puccinia triticina 1-1 BBBD Race 1]